MKRSQLAKMNQLVRSRHDDRMKATENGDCCPSSPRNGATTKKPRKASYSQRFFARVIFATLFASVVVFATTSVPLTDAWVRKTKASSKDSGGRKGERYYIPAMICMQSNNQAWFRVSKYFVRKRGNVKFARCRSVVYGSPTEKEWELSTI